MGFAIGSETIRAPRGQASLGGEPYEPLGQFREQGNPIAQIHESMQARRQPRVARQIGDEALARAEPTFPRARRENLDLHARHVDAGRAFAAARLAGNAELQRLGHLVGRQRIGAELT